MANGLRSQAFSCLAQARTAKSKDCLLWIIHMLANLKSCVDALRCATAGVSRCACKGDSRIRFKDEEWMLIQLCAEHNVRVPGRLGGMALPHFSAASPSIGSMGRVRPRRRGAGRSGALSRVRGSRCIPLPSNKEAVSALGLGRRRSGSGPRQESGQCKTVQASLRCQVDGCTSFVYDCASSRHRHDQCDNDPCLP